MKHFFTLEYWIDDGWYVGKLNEISGVFSQGKTLDELRENIIDAYKMVLEASNFDIEHPKSEFAELCVEM